MIVLLRASIVLLLIENVFGEFVELQYAGCWKDSPSDRDLGGARVDRTASSVLLCASFCTNGTEFAYPYFGLQQSWCYCGVSYGSYGRLPESECSPCINQSTLCGGKDKNSVFKMDVEFSELPEVRGSGDLALGVAAVVVGMWVSSGFAPGGVMRVALLSCGEVPMILNPTGLTVGGSEMGGAGLAAFLVAISVALLCALLLYAANDSKERLCDTVSTSDIQGLLRLPSLPLLIYQLCYTSLSLGVVPLLQLPLWYRLLGVLLASVCIAVPFVVFRLIKSNVPDHGIYAKAKRGVLLRAFIGSGEWVNLRPTTLFTQRHFSTVHSYRQPLAWFIILEFCTTFALGLIKGLSAEADTVGCGHASIAMGFVLMVLFMVKAVLQPHARKRDNITDLMVLALQIAVCGDIAVGQYGEGSTMSEALVTMVYVILLLKVLCDAGCEVYIACSGRRRRLQKDIYVQDAALPADALSLGSCETLTAYLPGVGSSQGMVPMEAGERQSSFLIGGGGSSFTDARTSATPTHPALLSCVSNGSLIQLPYSLKHINPHTSQSMASLL